MLNKNILYFNENTRLSLMTKVKFERNDFYNFIKKRLFKMIVIISFDILIIIL
jgi:hypothetical protein